MADEKTRRAPKKAVLPDNIRAEVKATADTFVKKRLKPKYAKQQSSRLQVLDIWTRWHGNAFYFCMAYAASDPSAAAPSREEKFARLEYVGNGLFNLSRIRYTGKWREVFTRLPLEECLEAIQEDWRFSLDEIEGRGE